MKTKLVLLTAVFTAIFAASSISIHAAAPAPANDPAEAAKFAPDYPQENWGAKTGEVDVPGGFTNEQVTQNILAALKAARFAAEYTGESLIIGSYTRGGVKYPAYVKYNNTHVDIYVNADKYTANLSESVRRTLARRLNSPQGRAAAIPFSVTEISTAAQLAAINRDAASLQANYLLMNDITVDDWIPIGDESGNFTGGGSPFRGLFDGNGHTITILRFHANPNPPRGHFATVNIGLFGTIGKGAIVKNLRVAGNLVYDSGATTLYMGAIAGENDGIISCCVSTASIHARGGKNSLGNAWMEAGIGQAKALSAQQAGIAGSIASSIVARRMGKAGAMDSQDRPAYQNEAAGGGIVGLNTSRVENCYATGPVTVAGEGFKTAGGVAGRNGFGKGYTGVIIQCYATGDIVAMEDMASRMAGGITGLCMVGKITDCVGLNGKLESVGNSKGVTVGGMGIGYTSNLAFGVIGENAEGTLANAYYRKDMIVNMGKDEDEKVDKSGKNKSIFHANRGKEVDYAPTQGQDWWKDAKHGVSFAFGNDDTAPWAWDAGLKRPILFWETPAGREILYNTSKDKPRAAAMAIAPVATAMATANVASAGSAPAEEKWGPKSCTVEVKVARAAGQVRQAILETLKAYRWVVESNTDTLIIGSYQRGKETYPIYVKYDSQHVDIYVNAGANSPRWAENLRRTLAGKLNMPPM